MLTNPNKSNTMWTLFSCVCTFHQKSQQAPLGGLSAEWSWLWFAYQTLKHRHGNVNYISSQYSCRICAFFVLFSVSNHRLCHFYLNLYGMLMSQLANHPRRYDTGPKRTQVCSASRIRRQERHTRHGVVSLLVITRGHSSRCEVMGAAIKVTWP